MSCFKSDAVDPSQTQTDPPPGPDASTGLSPDVGRIRIDSDRVDAAPSVRRPLHTTAPAFNLPPPTADPAPLPLPPAVGDLPDVPVSELLAKYVSTVPAPTRDTISALLQKSGFYVQSQLRLITQSDLLDELKDKISPLTAKLVAGTLALHKLVQANDAAEPAGTPRASHIELSPDQVAQIVDMLAAKVTPRGPVSDRSHNPSPSRDVTDGDTTMTPSQLEDGKSLTAATPLVRGVSGKRSRNPDPSPLPPNKALLQFLSSLFTLDLSTGVLSEGQHLFGDTAEGRRMFVRSCFAPVANLCAEALDSSANVIVKGTAGIGKSVFAFYLIARLLQRRKQQRESGSLSASVPVSIYYQRGDHTFRFDETGVVELDKPIRGSDLYPHDYFIFDAFTEDNATIRCCPPTPAQVCIVASPRAAGAQKHILNSRKQLRYCIIPTWTLQEVSQFTQANNFDAARSQAMFLNFVLVGGVMRLLLQETSRLLDTIDARKLKITEGTWRYLHQDPTNPSPPDGADLINLFLHINPSSDFTGHGRIVLATPYLTTVLALHLESLGNGILQRFITSAGPNQKTVAGQCFEAIAMRRVAEGATLTVRNLVTNATRKRTFNRCSNVREPTSLNPAKKVKYQVRVGRSKAVNAIQVSLPSGTEEPPGLAAEESKDEDLEEEAEEEEGRSPEPDEEKDDEPAEAKDESMDDDDPHWLRTHHGEEELLEIHFEVPSNLLRQIASTSSGSLVYNSLDEVRKLSTLSNALLSPLVRNAAAIDGIITRDTSDSTSQPTLLQATVGRQHPVKMDALTSLRNAVTRRPKQHCDLLFLVPSSEFDSFKLQPYGLPGKKRCKHKHQTQCQDCAKEDKFVSQYAVEIPLAQAKPLLEAHAASGGVAIASLLEPPPT